MRNVCISYLKVAGRRARDKLSISRGAGRYYSSKRSAPAVSGTRQQATANGGSERSTDTSLRRKVPVFKRGKRKMALVRCDARLALAALAVLAALTLAATAEIPASNNRYKPCVRDDTRTGFCVPDTMCFANFTLSRGGDILDTDVRIDDPPIPESQCGDMIWCCVEDNGTPVPPPVIPTAPPSIIPTAPPPVIPTAPPSIIPTAPPPVIPTAPPTEIPTAPPTVIPTAPPSVIPTVPPPVITNKTNCALYYGECPWCVGLYRIGGDVSRGVRMESGLYCVGALLAPRVVLTSGTCVRTVGKESVWARVPSAANPAQHYTVIEKIVHPNYNSGSHANDFGLFVLKDEVRWAAGPTAACVGRGGLSASNCVAVGFDENEEITATTVSVTDGDCPGRRRPRPIPDLACGNKTEDTCYARPGSPVLCPSTADGQGGMEIVGVARRNCVAGMVLLGKLQLHVVWLEERLRQLGVALPTYAA